ncbi:MAG: hypothetical protein ACOZQL_20095 [Myxococcota bacterium]
MSTAADWQASAVQIAGLYKQAKLARVEARALARCSPETRAVFENPWSARWHSGVALSEFSAALVAELGREGFAKLNADMARASFGPILRPMLQVALALTGRSPATVLSRLPASLESALRNVETSWAQTGPRAGTLRFRYPNVIEADTEWAWRGVFDFISELAGTPLRLERVQVDCAQGTLVFELAW